jgi:hypothetical protein
MDEILKEKRNKRDNREKKLLPHSLKVAGILKMFLSREIRNTNDLKISVSDLYKIDIDDPELLIQFKEVFLKEFERLGLNETEYTKDEAIEAIHNFEDDDWFTDHGIDFHDIEIDPESVTEDLIDSYRSEHYKPREITLELVNNSVSELELRQNRLKGRFGAKIKNLAIGELAKRLSYLHRIHQFFNPNEHTSIKEYPLSNLTCRLVYDYLEFWNLLSDDIIHNVTTKEQRTNYAKSLIRNNEEFFNKMMYVELRYFLGMIDRNLEIKIDLFKKVKDGLITPEEFYQA